MDMSLKVLLSRPEPQHTWKWVYAGATLPFGLPYSYVEACSLPLNNVSSGSPIFVNGGFLKMAGSHELGPISLTLFEDHKGSTLKWIQTWKSRIKNFKTGAYGTQTEYKRDLKFSLVDTMGSTHTTLLFTGCWPTDTSPLDLNYTESGKLTITQSFDADDVEIV